MIRYGRQEREDAAIPDPGNGGTILVDRSHALCQLISVAAETRLLPRPLAAGLVVTISHCENGGDITLTVTGGYDDSAYTDLMFYEAGQFYVLQSFFDGSAYFWRVIANYGLLNLMSTVNALNTQFLNLAATTDELNQAAHESSNTQVVITTNAIDDIESGATYYLDLAAGFTSTLPAPRLGARFEFIVKTAPTGAAYVITTTSGANVIYGQMLERAGGAGVAGAAQDTFNFVANQAKIGDWVRFRSDGTNWYYYGMVDVAAGNTVAVT